MTLANAIWVDLATLVVAAALLAARGNLRHSHPLVIYGIFHTVTFSARSWAVASGAQTFLFASHSEIARALNYADLFLLAGVVGALVVTQRPEAHDTHEHRPFGSDHPQRRDELSWRSIRIVGLISVPVGAFSLLTYTYVPGRDFDSAIASTAYSRIPATWIGLVLVMLIFKNGFRLAYMFPMVTYLMVMSLQGYGRFRVVIPLILLAQIWLDRSDRRWPPLRMVALGLVAFFLFIPLKDIGQGVRNDSSTAEITHNIERSVSETISGRSADQTVLDQLATTLTLVDDRGVVFYGKPYLSTVTLPIPRAVWPEKPGLNDHILQISTSARPLGRVGGVTTLVGDLYLNFRREGMIFFALVLGFAVTRWYRRAYRATSGSAARLLYLVVASSLIQVARDGLISVIGFVVLQSIPILAAILVSWMTQADERPGRSHRSVLRGSVTRS